MRATRRAAFCAAWLCLIPAAALAQASSSSGFKLGGEEPIAIESDRLEVRERDNIAIFSGNVNLVQGDLLLRTVKMTVYYANRAPSTGASTGGATPAAAGGGGPTGGTEIDRMEAEGKVYIKQGEQVATGDQGSFDMASGVMVLTGQEVVLTEGENVVVGCKLTSNTRTGQSQLDGCGRGGGRVKMLLQPGSQSR